jgi:hypothetical protein
MTKGTIVGCMAVVAGVLLATVASVYADHAATERERILSLLLWSWLSFTLLWQGRAQRN